MATATNPNQYVLLDNNIPQVLKQPSFGFTIGQTPAGGFTPISSFLLYLILIASLLAAIGRVIYALSYKILHSDDKAKIAEGNKMITSAMTTILLMASVTLIMSKVNPDMVTGNVDFSRVVVTSKNNNPAQSSVPAVIQTGSTISGNELAVRNQFNTVGITINKSPCATPSSKDCTDVGGLKSNIIDTVLQLRQACGCTFIINGGSEAGGHTATSNHPKGLAVDIEPTNQLRAFFSDSKKSSDSLCGPKYSFGGLIFWDEGPGCDGITTSRHYHASPTGN